MENLTEVWKSVKGCEGRYEVSNLGRVRSLDGITIRRNGSPFLRKGKMLCGSVGNHGYLTIRISRRHKLIHRLVLEAFVGPCPDGMEACHGPDPTHTNNRQSNLRWDTPKSNQGDRVQHGTSNDGERCGNAKLTKEQAQEILSSCESTIALGKRFSVTPSAISLIRTGKNWKSLQAAEAAS